MVDKNEKFYIGTTRFTNDTWRENEAWRKKHAWKGCMYGLNKKIPQCVPHLALVYVIEMNNDENKIMGIGLVRNFINLNTKSCVYYKDTNYNRYIYNSDYRKNRSQIEHKKMLEALELLLFKGSGHYKRGQGITTIGWHKFKDSKTKRIIKGFFESLFQLK